MHDGTVLQLEAPAKINLALAVTGREDGYHLLDSVMQEIDLADSLEMRLATSTTLTVTGGVLPAINTVTKAAHLFHAACGLRGGAEIQLHKRIPVQAGLGGGSSDGAAVLKGLNALHGLPFSELQLAELAKEIGADCPFFLRGGVQRARGIGEVLSPIRNRCHFALLLVKPTEGVATGPAFALADSLPEVRPDISACVAALADGDAEQYFATAGNALQPAAEHLVPVIRRLGGQCLQLGASYWQVTGSGSCLFAAFADEDARDRAAAQLQAPDLFVRAVRAVGGSGGKAKEEDADRHA